MSIVKCGEGGNSIKKKHEDKKFKADMDFTPTVKDGGVPTTFISGRRIYSTTWMRLKK